MFEVNTMDGKKIKTVAAKIVLHAEFEVGGTDDSDRIDSVMELFKDHRDDIVDNSFLRNAITSADIQSVEIKEENHG